MSDTAVIIVTAPPGVEKSDLAFMTKIEGRESVLRCMELFTNREGIAQAMLVIDQQQAEEIKRKIGSHLMFMGIKLAQAGPTWHEQVAAGLAKLPAEIKHVLVHDAARPAVAYTDLDAILALAGKHTAVALATRVPGVLADAGAVPGPGKLSGAKVAQVVTPMLFERSALGDAAAQKRLPEKLELIEGSPLNVRCGWSEASVVKAMVSLLPKPKMKAPSSPFEEAQW